MENMGNYILSVLKTSPMILFSWGACGFRELENNKGLSMIVNGFVYKGKVLIEYNEGADAFDVIIGEERHTPIYVDMLVEFIDAAVETNNNIEQYKEKINNFPKKPNSFFLKNFGLNRDSGIQTCALFPLSGGSAELSFRFATVGPQKPSLPFHSTTNLY